MRWRPRSRYLSPASLERWSLPHPARMYCGIDESSSARKMVIRSRARGEEHQPGAGSEDQRVVLPLPRPSRFDPIDGGEHDRRRDTREEVVEEDGVLVERERAVERRSGSRRGPPTRWSTAPRRRCRSARRTAARAAAAGTRASTSRTIAGGDQDGELRACDVDSVHEPTLTMTPSMAGSIMSIIRAGYTPRRTTRAASPATARVLPPVVLVGDVRPIHVFTGPKTTR